MSWLFNDLPIHILLVHAIVVAVPVAALCLVLAVSWPEARRRLGVVTPLLALASLVGVPITTEAGEALEEQVNESALSELHGHLGKDLLPWVIALFVVALVQWVWFRFFTGKGRFAGLISSRTLRIVVTVVLIVVAVGIAVGASVETYIIGESGARAVWSSRV
ncbi:MAG: hypothetical protein ABI566_07935 [Pseudolysinimonas sp.]